MTEQLFQFHNGKLQPCLDGGDLLLIDSFASFAGKIVAFDLHQARFARGVQALAPELSPQLADFWRAGAACFADWTGFPRVECVRQSDGLALRLRLRPNFASADTLRVLIGPHGDLRRQPRIKGADLSQCQTWSNLAKANDCDEYLISDDWGMPLEGAYSALIWWRGERLCALPEDAPVLASVTRAVLLRMAASRGVATDFERPSLADLQKNEVWLVNARSGPRRISRWSNGQVGVFESGRLALWKQHWQRSAD